MGHSYQRNRTCIIKLITISLLMLMPVYTFSKEKYDPAILQKVFSYSATIDTTKHDSIVRYCYHKYILSTDKRNIILLAVPTLYEVAHDKSRL
ncbi:MAG: hypothetical protein II416_12945, partial [Prevotella sp.]|nr:hypothetical protein [Prevotella sp.]